MKATNLGLGANPVCAIDPDVFRHHGAFLVELQEFEELGRGGVRHVALAVEISGRVQLTLSVLEMVVDSACRGCHFEGGERLSSRGWDVCSP